ncbi:MAG: hypothetical protein ABFC96_09595 [Thermoguttaceae bacterium]
MSIRCVCRNGHVLTAKDSLAGKVALCPACKTRLTIPSPQECSEDVIMTILGEHTPRHGDTFDDFDALADTSPSGIGNTGMLKKRCERCSRAIPAQTHICPYCRSYIATLRDF